MTRWEQRSRTQEADPKNDEAEANSATEHRISIKDFWVGEAEGLLGARTLSVSR